MAVLMCVIHAVLSDEDSTASSTRRPEDSVGLRFWSCEFVGIEGHGTLPASHCDPKNPNPNPQTSRPQNPKTCEGETNAGRHLSCVLFDDHLCIHRKRRLLAFRRQASEVRGDSFRSHVPPPPEMASVRASGLAVEGLGSRVGGEGLRG